MYCFIYQTSTVLQHKGFWDVAACDVLLFGPYRGPDKGETSCQPHELQ